MAPCTLCAGFERSPTHRSGPWLRKSTGTYYVQINGKQVNLGRDKAAAQKKWHALQAGEAVNVDRVDAALDAFLAVRWCVRISLDGFAS